MMIAYIEVDQSPPRRCLVPDGLAIHKGESCIVKSDRIQEFGKVINLEEEEVPTEEEKKAVLPEVVRCATLQDKAKADETTLMGKMAMDTCKSRAEKYGLKMRLIKVRYSFDRSVLTVMFSAEERLDFREMVKELAGELSTRVEMRQLGVRDEAGLTGGIGPCGRDMCCCTWLHKFESINVRMAKAQRLSLNPQAISGMCGRLKCCLRYEFDQYKEADKHLPRDGACVKCPGGEGRVCGKNILAERVKVRLEDERIVEYSVDELEQ
jgi:cell fate regulator YaaT (PSP1 superfamily)